MAQIDTQPQNGYTTYCSFERRSLLDQAISSVMKTRLQILDMIIISDRWLKAN
jgi:hypothetical protein